MLFDQMNISIMTKEYARQISLWKYDGAYSFYDHDGNIDEFLDNYHYFSTNSKGELIGFFCFGNNAQIPTIEENVYDTTFIDIGLGLRPDLCGKNLGLSFLNAGLDFARDIYQTNHFRLSVAAFNERAIKVYKSANFFIDQEVTNSYFNNKFYIMKCIQL